MNVHFPLFKKTLKKNSKVSKTFYNCLSLSAGIGDFIIWGPIKHENAYFGIEPISLRWKSKNSSIFALA